MYFFFFSFAIFYINFPSYVSVSLTYIFYSRWLTLFQFCIKMNSQLQKKLVEGIWSSFFHESV